MTDERLPDGPDLDEMIQLIRGPFPDAVVATIDSAAIFSLDDKSHATVRASLMPLIAEGHDRLAAKRAPG